MILVGMARTRLLTTLTPRRALRLLPLAQHTRNLTSSHTARQNTHPKQTTPRAQTPDSQPVPLDTQPQIRNEPLSFPCLDALDTRTATLRSRLSSATTPSSLSNPTSTSGPEPTYSTGTTKSFSCPDPLVLDHGSLPSFSLAYETWGKLNADRSNAILLPTGLSASSHAASTEENARPGWWEGFIGHGKAVDTKKYFVVCANVLGGCFGSTGPSSYIPSCRTEDHTQGVNDGDSETGRRERYATRFPILTMQDMVRAQFRLLDHLGIEKLYACVGSSMGGMQSLAAGVLQPERVGRVVSISGCARSHPYSIAMRHTQRQVLMNDPAWASTRGNYYDSIPPHAGMKLAREIATITYRSGPEWEQRFGRRRADPSKPPALCPDFLIETYLDHAGEKWCLEYDANSLLYVSKAMDLFDLGAENMAMLDGMRNARRGVAAGQECLALPETPYQEQTSEGQISSAKARDSSPPEDLVKGLMPMRDTPTLVMGVASDILFPAWQQREIAETLRRTGNQDVEYVELGEDKSLFGHDTFLLDVKGVGGEIQRFLR